MLFQFAALWPAIKGSRKAKVWRAKKTPPNDREEHLTRSNPGA